MMHHPFPALARAACLALVPLAAACVASPPPAPPQLTPLPGSRWDGKYSYRYDEALETARPASVPVTMAVVNPDYRVKESALDKKPYDRVGRGFSASMGVDMEKILVARGMTVKGPFPHLEEMTYSDKKGCDLTLAPKLFVEADFKYVAAGDAEPGKAVLAGQYEPGKHFMTKTFRLTVTGWIAFAMQEPMSAEKMWIKKLDLEEMVIEGVEAYEAVPHYTTVTEQQFLAPPVQRQVLAGYNPGKMLWDGKVDGMADALARIYPVVLGKLRKFIDIEELKVLKAKTAEIRQLKRY